MELSLLEQFAFELAIHLGANGSQVLANDRLAREEKSKTMRLMAGFMEQKRYATDGRLRLRQPGGKSYETRDIRQSLRYNVESCRDPPNGGAWQISLEYAPCDMVLVARAFSRNSAQMAESHSYFRPK